MQQTSALAIWMPLVVATCATVLGLIAYSIQSASQRRARYQFEVQERYERYLHTIFDVMANSADEDRHAAFNKVRASLRLFASREVLLLAKKFEDHVTRTSLTEDPMGVAGSLVNAMRNHVLPRRTKRRDKLSDRQMQNLLSFNVN